MRGDTRNTLPQVNRTTTDRNCCAETLQKGARRTALLWLLPVDTSNIIDSYIPPMKSKDSRETDSSSIAIEEQNDLRLRGQHSDNAIIINL